MSNLYLTKFVGAPKLKELSPCHKLRFSNPIICCSPSCGIYKFQNMNSLKLKNLSWKYQRFTPSGGNIEGLHHQVAKFKNLILLQKLNSFNLVLIQLNP